MAANCALSRHERDAPVALTRIPLARLATPSIPPSMASNVDGPFVEDVDVDQELRARDRALHSQSNNDSDDESEDAPLLSPTAQDYGSASGPGSAGSSELQWPGEADFKGLTWWNRPSVRPPDRYTHKALVLTCIDILAPPAVPSLHHRLWWCHHTQDQPDYGPRMHRVLRYRPPPHLGSHEPRAAAGQMPE
jgi:hypothetical protein